MIKLPEQYRRPRTQYTEWGGVFDINRGNLSFQCIVSTGPDWEHLSVTVYDNRKKTHRCASWNEMCWLKDLFWEDSDVVIQYHPAKSEYVNDHPHCLHLWRPLQENIPVPPSIYV